MNSHVWAFLGGFVFCYLGMLFNSWVQSRMVSVTGFKARTHRPETAERRIDEVADTLTKQFGDQTIAIGMKQLAEFYKEEGKPVPNQKALRKEVEQMLNDSLQGESRL